MSDTTEGSCGACTENLMETDAFIRSAVYKMDYKRRGLALIFNQEQFDCPKLKERRGTNVDRDNLEQRLRDLKFEVKVYDNYKQAEVLDIITKAAKEDHSDADCFLLVFLSHGENDHVYARDGEIKIQKMTGLFKGNECQSLVGKPKIFVFQACRGDQYDDPVTGASVGSFTDSNKVEEDACSLQTLPAGADFIMCYCVAEGYYSYRDPRNGSWYIQDLCKLLQKYGNTLEFTELLTLVNRKVSMRSVGNCKDRKAIGKKQAPCFASMLTKKLYFRPKK